MDKEKIFRCAVSSILYLTVKDMGCTNKEDFIRRKKDISVDVLKKIKNQDVFISVKDKDRKVQGLTKEFKQYFKNTLLSESNFFAVLKTFTDYMDSKEKQLLFDTVANATFIDRKVTDEEYEVLYQLNDDLNLSIENINDYLQKQKKELSKIKKNKGIGLKNSFFISILIMVSCTLITLFLFYKGNSMKGGAISEFFKSDIVYQTINFDKYIVAANACATDKSSTTQKYLGKAVVFYVKGSADVEFNLSNFQLDGDKVVYIGRKYKGIKKIMPFKIDVNIDQNNFFEVYELEPHKITPKEAKSVAAKIAVVTGVAGAYMGGQAGSSIGAKVIKFFPIGQQPFGDLLGSILGGAYGGATGGIAGGTLGYISTQKLLTGFHFTDDIGQQDKIRIQEKTKSLIAADIYADKRLRAYLKGRFENYVKCFLKQYKINVREFVYRPQAVGEGV